MTVGLVLTLALHPVEDAPAPIRRTENVYSMLGLAVPAVLLSQIIFPDGLEEGQAEVLERLP